MDKSKQMHLGLGRVSPPVNKGGFSGASSMAPQRFNGGLMGPPPGLDNMHLDDLNVERDAYGQPLSPTHQFTNNRNFNELSPPRDGAEQVKSQSYNLLGKNAQNNKAGNLGSDKIENNQVAGAQTSGSGATNGNQASDAVKKNEESLQQGLKGAPKFAGLSSYEYMVDGGLKYFCAEAKEDNLDEPTIQRYHKIFHRKGSNSINRKNIQIETDKRIFSLDEQSVQVPGKFSKKIDDSPFQSQSRRQNYQMEIAINLPVQTMVEQIEIKLNSNAEKFDLWSKYLKISGVTRSSLLRKEALERDAIGGQDIQMTVLSQEAMKGDADKEQRRFRAQKYLRLQSGFLDSSKKTMELNFCGAVTHQVNLQFEFDRQKALELIQTCKEIQAKKIGLFGADKSSGLLDQANIGEPVSQSEKRQQRNEGQNANKATQGDPLHNQISNTQSQFISSYGGDIYDAEGSELDDLDNEVSNIARKLQSKRNAQNFDQGSSSASDLKKTEMIKTDDIELDFGEERKDLNKETDHSQPSQTEQINSYLSKTQSGQNLNKKFNNEAAKMSNTAGNPAKEPMEYTAEEKQLFEERKLFEGSNESQWAMRLLQQVLLYIKVIGFNMNKIPAITNLAHLMNTSFYLRKDKIHLEDALEVDFLQGTLLISSKRNTQAVELLRNKVQAPYLKQIEANLARLQGRDEQYQNKNKVAGRSRDHEPKIDQEQDPILSFDDRQNLKVQTKKLYTRAAIIELMCSESMCIRPQLNDKLQSLVRMTSLCRGQLVGKLPFTGQIFMADDEYTTMIKILPFMLKFTIQCIENNQQCNREVVIVSALRNIQFILETQGCSLDSAMIVILKSLFKNYPDRIKQEKVMKRAREFRGRILKGGGNDKESASGSSGPAKTLLSEARRVGGIHGTCSANELNLRSQQQMGMDSQKDIQQMMNYQFNQNSARGSGTTDQMPLDEATNLQNEMQKTTRAERLTMIESIFSLSWIHYRDEPASKKEPNSGFEKTLMNLFNNLLETYISVLSSISSHILHQIFYEVIVPCLVNQPFEEDKARFEALDKEDQQIHSEFSSEVKIFAVKIAEKIITICQGDLIMNRGLLDTLVKSQSAPSFKKQLELSSEQLRAQMKNLWSSIRSKVFTNYSMKGFKQLIEWLVSKMSLLAQNCTILDGRSSASEIAMLELAEDDLQQLSQYLEIITFISVGRRNNQEEANSLIKIKQDYCMDLYLLLNPLLFWLDFSVEREERLTLFKQVYQTIKDVLENLPPKKVDIDILQIIIPILQRTSEYLRQNSPTQSMLKFLDIVLQDIKIGKYCQTNYPDLQYFFLDQLNSIVNYISYCLYEEVFPVFDKLLSLCQDVMTERILKKCIMALIDKYTMRNKAHKQSISSFVKSLMEVNIDSISKPKNFFKEQKSERKGKPGMNHELIDIFDQEIDIVDNSTSQRRREITGGSARQTSGRGQQSNKKQQSQRSNFFEVMLDYCFFENDDEPAKVAAEVLKSNKDQVDDTIIRKDASLQFRSPNDLHELFIDKLQFFIDALNLMGERHVNLFSSLIFNPKFKKTIFGLLLKGETNLRLKCHEILEIIGTYFIQYCSSKTLYELAVPSGGQYGSSGTERNRRNLLSDNGNRQDFEMMEVDFINHERLYISQMIVQCVRKSFELNNGNDSYLQFNSLILLDYLFQNILPVPSFSNEQLKQRQNMENQIIQQKKFLNQQGRNRDANIQGLNESQMEDGSSGGEGTTGRAAAAAAAARQGQGSFRGLAEEANAREDGTGSISMHQVQRQLNSNYLGEIEDGIDLETVQITERTPELEVTDHRYTAMRLKLVYKLWPYVQEALNSPWSNIRSICYGLICSMLKVDVRDCNKYLPFLPVQRELIDQQIEVRLGGSADDRMRERQDQEKLASDFEEKDKELLEQQKYYIKLRQFVIPMMINLLSSKESESKAGGLNILGSICGLSYDFSKIKISRNMEFFKRNSEFVSLPIWQLVFELQDDWDITIKEASIVLIQLCAPREAIKYFNKCKVDKENQKFQQMLSKMARNGGGQGGHGSMSNLSSARQNSLYNHINSKGSLNGLKKCMNENGGDLMDLSQRRIDYKKVDFGYKNKAIPNIPGLLNEFGKLDMATFLSDKQDMMNINIIDEENVGSNDNGVNNQNLLERDMGRAVPSLARNLQIGDSRQIEINQMDSDNTDKASDPILGGNRQLALDLGKIYQTKDETQKKSASGAFDVEAAFMQSSLSQRSNFFGNANNQQLQLNQQILMHSQQQNQNLAQAMLGANPATTQSSQANLLNQQFDFFVDDYSDEQIQEIISIFRNDFKPPKNLWIEKAAESSVFNGPDFYADIYASAIEAFNQQQMILQQKQQQELQDQVSNGSSTPQGLSGLSMGTKNIVKASHTLNKHGTPRVNAGEFSPPGLRESSSAEELALSQGINQNASQSTQQNAQNIQIDDTGTVKKDQISQKRAANNDQNQDNQGQDALNAKEKPIQKNPQGQKNSESPISETLELLEQSSSGGAPAAEERKQTQQAKQGQNEAESKQSQKKSGPKKPFDPSDLNIFEQINFDEMNINLEDINQSNQKQDVINSSNSDIGDQGGDSSVEFGGSSGAGNSGGGATGPNLQAMMIPGGLPQQKQNGGHQPGGDVEAAHQLLANDMLDTSNELLQEVEVLDQNGMDIYGDEEDGGQSESEIDINLQQNLNDHLQVYDGMDINSSPSKEEKKQMEKYKNIGSIGTELQIIESMSNEVSSNSRQNSQQNNQNGDPSPNEIVVVETGPSRGSQTGSESMNNVSRDYPKTGYSGQKQVDMHTGVLQALKQPFQQKDVQETGYDESHPISIQDGLAIQNMQNSKRITKEQFMMSNLPQQIGKNGGDFSRKSNDQLLLNQNLSANQMQIADQNLALKMMSSSGQTIASQATQSAQGRDSTYQIQLQNSSSAATSSGAIINMSSNNASLSQTHPDQNKHRMEMEQDMQILAQQQQIAQYQQLLKEQQQYDIHENAIKYGKQVSNSSSTPDFKSQLQQVAQKNAQQKQKLKDLSRGINGMSDQELLSMGPQKHSSDLESNKHNFVKSNIPLGAGHTSGANYGNFSHRVPGQSGHGTNYNSNSQGQPSKKQILKNLKQINVKTNQEDYFIMQNISNQMGGQLAGPLGNINLATNGLNTTKNKKVDKSLENLVSIFKKEKQTKSGHGTSLGRINNTQKQVQSQESSLGLVNKLQTQARGGTAKRTNNAQTHRNAHGHTKSAGVTKKTLSTSPKRPQNEITKLLMGTKGSSYQVAVSSTTGSKQHQSNIASNQGSSTTGGQRASKSHRSGGGPTATSAINQSAQLSSNQQNNSKKIKENMRDLNYFIKTIEKFSKTSNIKVDSGGSHPSQPQILSPGQTMAQGQNVKTTLSSTGGASGSDPQTPKDVLINLGDQMNQLLGNKNPSAGPQPRKSSNYKGSSTNKGKIPTVSGLTAQNVKTTAAQKSKSTNYSNHGPSSAAQQLYEQMNSHQGQSQQISLATAENIQNQLKKNGFNLSQLNKILSKGAAAAASAENGGSRGSRGRSGGRGAFDLTPDSHGNGGAKGYQIQAMRQGVSKSSKSNNSHYGTSYSPQNRGTQKSQNSNQNYKMNPLSNLNIKTNMQGIISSQRDGHSSVDSNSRPNGQRAVSGQGGRSTSGNGRSRKINFASEILGDMNGGKSQKSKKLSFNLNQPPQLNNLMHMNYSQTQKFDLREINQQLMAASGYGQKGGGSTQNKTNNNGIFLYKNQGKEGQVIHSQRERKEKSAGSTNSTKGPSQNQVKNNGMPGSTTSGGGQFHGGALVMSKNTSNSQNKGAQKYNNLMLSNKYATQDGQRSGSHQAGKPGGLSSPRNDSDNRGQNKVTQSANRGNNKQVIHFSNKAPSSARAGAPGALANELRLSQGITTKGGQPPSNQISRIPQHTGGKGPGIPSVSINGQQFTNSNKQKR